MPSLVQRLTVVELLLAIFFQKCAETFSQKRSILDPNGFQITRISIVIISNYSKRIARIRNVIINSKLKDKLRTENQVKIYALQIRLISLS